MNRPRIMSGLPIAAVGVLAACLALELRASALGPVSSAHAAVEADEAAPALAIEFAPADASREVTERPLFFRSRRPLPPEPPAVAEPRPEPQPPLTFALVGTIVTGPTRVALVKPEKAASVELAVGQSLEGWTLTTIDADRVMVRHGGTEQLLGLRDFGAKAQSAVARGPAAARPVVTQAATQAAPPAPPPGPSGAARRAGRR